MKTIPAPPIVSTNSTKSDMVSMTKEEFVQFTQMTVREAIASVNPKAKKAKVDRKAATKARSEEAIARCMAVSGKSAEFVKSVFTQAHSMARGLPYEEYKNKYNEICIEALGAPRYIPKAV